MNGGGDCRTAPATLGLLKTLIHFIWVIIYPPSPPPSTHHPIPPPCMFGQKSFSKILEVFICPRYSISQRLEQVINKLVFSVIHKNIFLITYPLLPHDLDGRHVSRPPVPLHPVHLAVVYLEGLYMLHANGHLCSCLVEQFY